jgi:hypothetical protein
MHFTGRFHKKRDIIIEMDFLKHCTVYSPCQQKSDNRLNVQACQAAAGLTEKKTDGSK